MIFVENVCVFGIILKRNNWSFCCFLNHIIYFCWSRVMLRLMRQGKIPFVPLFVFIEEIVMKVSTTKQLICEDNNERNYWSIILLIYLLLSSTRTKTHTRTQTNTHTNKHTHTHTLKFCIYVTHSNWLVCVGVCMFVYVCMCVLSSTCTNTPYIHHTHAH